MDGMIDNTEQQKGWRRQLEHGRLSQLALPGSDDNFPGPGAAEAGSPEKAAAGEGTGEGGEGSAQQAVAAASKAVGDAVPVFNTRISLWSSLGTIAAIPLVPAVVAGHKLISDGKLKNAATTVKAAMSAAGAKIEGLPFPKFAVGIFKKLIDVAVKILTVEWFVVALLAVVIYGLIFFVLIMIIMAGYCLLNPIECGLKAAGVIN